MFYNRDDIEEKPFKATLLGIDYSDLSPQELVKYYNNGNMFITIVDYIDIVEQQIGVGNFDKDDWSVDSEQYMQITFAINGTAGDESRLEGKTRADVPENRQALLKFLEEKGWLYEQFK